MKRLHLHVNVPDLAQSIRFYETLFGAGPTVRKDDYAKWMLDDPKVNFAISERGREAGLDHVGVQVDSKAELDALAGRLKAAGEATLDQTAAACCYATSDKSWVEDPAGLKWETFFTFGEITDYGKDGVPVPETVSAGSACCGAPAAAPQPKPVTAGCCG
ncbi:ArsI/CadI family heavy metal resistance metalloenzyme [Phenylobacterium soli]|uniref:Glyoxalase/bleomycin resistance/dioxygenase family protein n=1 Tax=Phenylobacterium soli TaxID=2170551 RepID=A0A328AB38_9CAUL|nr:ArsI/CadI family heavy metal resistance metalloenzyme [Phenylobacterium soli]RAK51840.1 glyoxalase/bleomycin resistance/dioxygenase family protein [Phenylobacterium soli]